MFVSYTTYDIKRVRAGIAEQDQSERIGGLPVTAEDEVSHYQGLHVTTGE